MYAVAGEVGAVNVALFAQVDPLVLTCNTTLAMPAVAAPVPVYAVSEADARLNAGVRVPMIPSLSAEPSSGVVIVRVPTVGAVVSTVTSAGDASVAVVVIPAVSVTTARTE